jgi:hypothetical protein
MQRLDDLMNQSFRQKGGMTVFTAIMVLIVLTLLMFYATRVSVFEQRVSANEVRQKASFHAAEAAIEQGIEYMLANSTLILSTSVDEFPDGNGTFTRDGWFASNRWLECTSALVADPDHPCGGDTPMREGSYFYDDPTTLPADTPVDSLPLAMGSFANDVTARLSANICFINIGDPAGSCEDPPSDLEEENNAYMIITMLGYGFSDCTDTTDVSTCTGEATVAKPVANFKSLAGAPVVPVTTKTAFEVTGTAEVVPNPNAGGIGVPISVWMNLNPSCGGATAELKGNWMTCEQHEWYGESELPADTTCGQVECKCELDEAISTTTGTSPWNGIDLIEDPAFPCDLFEYYFKVPRSLYQTVKNSATIVTDCNNLGSQNSGLVWITGGSCDITGGRVIGSPRSPVILVAATETKFVSGTTIYGVLYVFDGEDPNATVYAHADLTIYGALIVDSVLGAFNGTFQVVYSGGVLANAAGQNGLGAVSGGWRDFGLPDLAW